jgi:serine/threonine protein phosphatase PrpC
MNKFVSTSNNLNEYFSDVEITHKIYKHVNKFENENYDLSIRPNKKQEILMNLNKTKPYINIENYGVIKGVISGSFINAQNNNHDRIAIYPNINIECDLELVPSIHVFALFTGYVDSSVSDAVRDKVIKYILTHELFLIKTHESILEAFKQIEKEIMNHMKSHYEKTGELRNSSAGVLIVLIIDHFCYTINLGSCRAIISQRDNVFTLTNNINHTDSKYHTKNLTRCIGGIADKLENNIIAIPDIMLFNITDDIDFLLIINQSICLNLNNSNICQLVYEALIEAIESHLKLEMLYDAIITKLIRECINLGIQQTLSCIILIFDSFIKLYDYKNIDIIRQKITNISERPGNIYNNFIKKIFCGDENNRSSNNITVINNNINNINYNTNYNYGNHNTNIVINNPTPSLEQSPSNKINITKETKYFFCGIFTSAKQEIKREFK